MRLRAQAEAIHLADDRLTDRATRPRRTPAGRGRLEGRRRRGAKARRCPHRTRPARGAPRQPRGAARGAVAAAQQAGHEVVAREHELRVPKPSWPAARPSWPTSAGAAPGAGAGRRADQRGGRGQRGVNQLRSAEATLTDSWRHRVQGPRRGQGPRPPDRHPGHRAGREPAIRLICSSPCWTRRAMTARAAPPPRVRFRAYGGQPASTIYDTPEAVLLALDPVRREVGRGDARRGVVLDGDRPAAPDRRGVRAGQGRGRRRCAAAKTPWSTRASTRTPR